MAGLLAGAFGGCLWRRSPKLCFAVLAMAGSVMEDKIDLERCMAYMVWHVDLMDCYCIDTR